jgi:very-short-patch-repair endonuclease
MYAKLTVIPAEAGTSFPSPLAGEGRVRGIGHRPYSQSIKKNSKALRRNSTDAERMLWQAVRGGRLGFKFRRQFPVDNKYIADFVCLKKRLIIELDGGQHNENEKDIARTDYLGKNGFAVIRFWNNDILENLDGCLEFLLNELTPRPIPLPQGERGKECV